jgi:excisionase family DNA binding protein
MTEESKRKAFWGLRELAEYLNVEYKTLYRQVIAGNLPAIRIGGIFRIRQEDVDAFLEKMRVPQKKERESLVNTFREDIYASLHPERKVSGLVCARCSRLIKSIHMIGGECQYPGCGAILCSECYANEEDRYCLEHTISAREKLDQAKQRLKKKEIDLLVTAEEARERELNFINRFDQKIRQSKHITSPINGTLQIVDSWDDIHEEEVESDITPPSLLKIPDHVATAKTFPRNMSSSYHFGRRGNSGKTNSAFVVKATCISHLHEYFQNGFDTRPLNHAELIWLLEQEIEKAKANHSLYIVGIGSPTGFDTQAQQTICGEADQRVFSSLYVAVCLVDLNANRLFCNPMDSRIKPFIDLYQGDLNGEAVSRVKNFLRNKLAERASQSIAEVVEATGEHTDVVAQAFAELGKEEGYSVAKTTDKGEVVILREA